MSAADKRKHRRLLYLGFAITVLLAFNEASCLLNGVYDIPLLTYMCTFRIDVYLFNGPLMFLLFSSHKDVLNAICCKPAQHNITQVTPVGIGSGNNQGVNANQPHVDLKVSTV